MDQIITSSLPSSLWIAFRGNLYFEGCLHLWIVDSPILFLGSPRSDFCLNLTSPACPQPWLFRALLHLFRNFHDMKSEFVLLFNMQSSSTRHVRALPSRQSSCLIARFYYIFINFYLGNNSGGATKLSLELVLSATTSSPPFFLLLSSTSNFIPISYIYYRCFKSMESLARSSARHVGWAHAPSLRGDLWASPQTCPRRTQISHCFLAFSIKPCIGCLH